MQIDPRGGRWITRYSARGAAYQIWQQAVPWIDPIFLESTVYLYPSEAEAEDGAHIGGSGFLVEVPLTDKNRPGQPRLLCVVTNAHVIDSGSMVVRLNTVEDQTDIIPLDAAKWYRHPSGDDLAICPIKLSSRHRTKAISTKQFLTKKIIESYDIGPGDEVFIVGRFVNHEGKQRNLPSVRFGNISQMPWEPIVVDGYPQESFLVEARSIAGYSGSPVFVFLPPVHIVNPPGLDLRRVMKDFGLSFTNVSSKRLDLPVVGGPWLMGIDYCHIRWDEPVWSRTTGRPVSDDWFIKSNTGMMGVVPAWKLAEILEGEEMKPLLEDAKRSAEKAVKDGTPIELDVAAPRNADAARLKNPNHKEDFTRLLNEAARKREQED